jgi:hypothetical protein
MSYLSTALHDQLRDFFDLSRGPTGRDFAPTPTDCATQLTAEGVDGRATR